MSAPPGSPDASATSAPPGTKPAERRLPDEPFAPDSIWRRPIPAGTATVAIDDMTGRPDQAITRVGLDLVTLCETDPAAPLVAIEQDQGWQLPGRATSNGVVQYQRHLADDACTDVTWNPIGNALFVLFDPSTGTADLGVGGWREPGGPLLNHAGDGRDAHGLDVFGGDGTIGYGRASGLPALGGLLRAGELDHGIDHALAVNVSNSLLSSTRPFVWPARSADGSAPIAYRGTNEALAMGTLLALPATFDAEAHPWRTPQGRAVALAAQRYGWYVVDSVPTPGVVQFAMDTSTARTELGLTISDGGARQRIDPAKLDDAGFVADVAELFTLLEAVPPT